MKAYEALSSALVAEGVEVVFGLIAGGIDDVIRDLNDVKKVRYVQVRHEEVAIGMADGYSRASGKIGVAIIDGGPGLMNACAPLMAARMSGSKVLVVMTGQAGGDRHTYDLVDRHNNMSFDQGPVLEATVGIYQAVRSPETLSQDVAQAFRHIQLGHGPIALTFEDGHAEMPAGWRYKPGQPRGAEPLLGAPRPADVQALAQRIKSAQRPLILAGRGAWRAGARDALRALADRSGALVATSLLGKDMFAGDPYTIGVSGGFALEDARPIMKQADLLIAFGCQLNDYTLGHGQLYAGAKVVQIDINPAAIGEYSSFDQAVVADARLTAEALLTALDQQQRPEWRGPAMAQRIKRFDRWFERDMEEHGGRANIRRVVDVIDKMAPRERMICIDIGLFMGAPAAYMHVPDPDGQVFPWQLGRVGCALPVAAGAAIGRPDRLMVAFVGDGGMMAAMNALDTVRSEKIPLMLVVMDDGGYGADRYIFERAGRHTHVADMDTPDLVSIARAYGLAAHKVTSGAGMETAMRSVERQGRASLFHVLMDYSVPAQEMDYAIYKSGEPH
jgi:acetolactate synthase-1/2/3 large subunit